MGEEWRSRRGRAREENIETVGGIYFVRGTFARRAKLKWELRNDFGVGLDERWFAGLRKRVYYMRER